MHKTDYELIARTLNKVYHTEVVSTDAEKFLYILVHELSEAFQAENKGFDKVKFVDAVYK